MIEYLTRQDFEELSSGSLQPRKHAGQQLELRVVETRDLPSVSTRQSSFSLVLEGPVSPVLPQAGFTACYIRSMVAWIYSWFPSGAMPVTRVTNSIFN